MVKLNGENKTRMKKAFDKFMKINARHHAAERLFQSVVESHYTNPETGVFVHYSDKDKDEIIDSIDYGLGGLTFERFNEIMEEINP
jgi:hypothetical protein